MYMYIYMYCWQVAKRCSLIGCLIDRRACSMIDGHLVTEVVSKNVFVSFLVAAKTHSCSPYSSPKSIGKHLGTCWLKPLCHPKLRVPLDYVFLEFDDETAPESQK